jgi:hypothetical protein
MPKNFIDRPDACNDRSDRLIGNTLLLRTFALGSDDLVLRAGNSERTRRRCAVAKERLSYA